MLIYNLSIFLTSTAFVSTNAKIRHTSFEIYRIFENCPLEQHYKKVSFLQPLKNAGGDPGIFEATLAGLALDWRSSEV